MSNIKPRGIPVQFGGEERHFLFDYAVIAEIQEAYNSDVLSAIRQLWMERQSPGEYKAKVMIDLVHKLLLDETEREKALNGVELKTYTKRQVGWYIDQQNADDILKAMLQAWSVSIPEPDEDTEPEPEEEPRPNGKRGTKKNSKSTSPA